MYLKEATVRRRGIASALGWGDAETALAFKMLPQIIRSRFDIFLSHAVRDAELVLGLKEILEATGRIVYIDWIDDPALDRSHVSGKTAEVLRKRMRESESLLYLHTRHSRVSRWMPWELGFFDGLKGNVAILPVIPDDGRLDFEREEFLQIYPKIDVVDVTGTPSLHVNRARRTESGDYLSFNAWLKSPDKLRPDFGPGQ
jgi:hypothetical protein